ncbi:hypothetical protein Focb16_v001979 [Fusarium oxysporum f. sp. cubense]|uniref:PNPLA domain-containing protein n=1 Tax=Fusarium oxysporum f. sp. cubense TaxID=61366 RepID=A0A559LAV9_FUSOC|nr:hypothetical protein Focb16_v001979 [Fusarium oxysporum f. sp. cubense]
MAISYRLNNDAERARVWRGYDNPDSNMFDAKRAHIWRSYDNPDSNTFWDRSVKIWEVALATSATPCYFDAIVINGSRYLDGSLVANNPSYRALREVSSLHNKSPVVFVNIGTGRQVWTEVILRSDAKWRDLLWRDRLQQGNGLFEHTTTKFYVDSETEKWLELAKSMGLEKAYRLNGAEENLQKIPYDDWRPAGTGQETLQRITDITEDYLRNDRVRDVINSIAHEAVRIRRARAMTERWRVFTKSPEFRYRNRN